jgi:hypothetical protein
MLTTRHAVDFAYTPQELQALFRYAREQDVERGGHDDARSAAINVWSHHWLHPAAHQESETIHRIGQFGLDIHGQIASCEYFEPE